MRSACPVALRSCKPNVTWEDLPGSESYSEIQDFQIRYIRNFTRQEFLEHPLQALNAQWFQPILQVKFPRKSVCRKLLEDFESRKGL